MHSPASFKQARASLSSSSHVCWSTSLITLTCICCYDTALLKNSQILLLRRPKSQSCLSSSSEYCQRSPQPPPDRVTRVYSSQFMELITTYLQSSTTSRLPDRSSATECAPSSWSHQPHRRRPTLSLRPSRTPAIPRQITLHTLFVEKPSTLRLSDPPLPHSRSTSPAR
jgi:hypothetical protein